MATLQINNNNNYKWIALVGLFVLLVYLGIGFRKCNNNVSYNPVSLSPEFKIKDSFRTIIKYHDSTRLHYVDRWRNRTRLVDSSPCYTEVKYVTDLCDTIIRVDSILISSLKANIANDSVIIFKQGLMLRADSLYICKLNKKLKRQKLFTKAAFVLGIGAGGFVGLKLK